MAQPSAALPADPSTRPLSSVLGKGTANTLGTQLGLATVGHLLHFVPRRYASRGEVTDLSSLRDGDEVTIVADVQSVRTRSMKYRRGTLTEAVLTDGTGALSATFFNGNRRPPKLEEGMRALFAGKVSRFGNKPQLTHPEFDVLSDDQAADEVAQHKADRPIPIYRRPVKLKPYVVRNAVKMVLPLAQDLPDPVPAEVRNRLRLLDLGTALRLAHQPETVDDIEPALRRLRFDEAFVLQVLLAQRRHELAQQQTTPRAARADGVLAAFDARLPFALTAGQREVAEQIANDLAQGHPMHRLLQGDVGSGKTVVALRAMLTVVDSGAQAALLAPTEVLAQQHARSIRQMLGPLADAGRLGGDECGTQVALLTGSLPTAARRQALLDVVSGTAGIVIGTHALLQENVDFFDLGLVVVDEQHRFGVEQRDALRAKGEQLPHLLVMTATPIPRTVAMTVFGDLEVSTLRDLPTGRSPVATHVVPAADKPHFLDRAWQRVREEVARSHQAYVVAPRIGRDDDEPPASEPWDDSWPLDADAPAIAPPTTAVLDVAESLRTGPLRDVRLEVLHGRLDGDVKDDVMRRFAAGDIDVLVATTVIEVGVDVANATVMVVLDADRFGVSQLHQLRGRVGRGSAPAVCLLVTSAPAGTPARRRVDAVASSTDGFALARLDLQQRREGDVLGTDQAGRRSSLRLLRVLRDEDLIVAARTEATNVVAADPKLRTHPALAAQVAAAQADEQAEYLDKA